MKLGNNVAFGWLLITLCWLWHEPLDAQQDKGPVELLRNAALQWQGESLPEWKMEVGAGSGPRISTIRHGNDGSLELTGTASTQTWNFVGQQVAVAAGDYLSFRYAAKATGLKRDAGQNDNCYAAIWYDRQGQQAGVSVFPVDRDEYMPQEQIIRVPDGVTGGRVTFFLSKTGTLNVKDVSLQKLQPKDSFEVFVRQMDRYYSYFDHKQIDWTTLSGRFRKTATAASDRQAFEAVLLEMLAELKDGHTWIMQGGQRVSRYRLDSPTPNFDFPRVERELKDVRRFGRLGLVGRTADNLGYVRLTSLTDQAGDMPAMIDATLKLFDTQGMVVDLRVNGGGNEELGKMLAGLFCEEPRVYARNRFRKNENHDEFYEYPRSPLQPHRDGVYSRPVVCLIGPGAVSSGEAMALMFDALPNATTIGQPTRGSSGNPAPLSLPNGVEVWFSRWVATDAAGNPIEDRGVQPDILVEPGSGDAAWEKAKQMLSR